MAEQETREQAKFYLLPSLRKKLRREAKVNGMSMSALLEELIDDMQETAPAPAAPM